MELKKKKNSQQKSKARWLHQMEFHQTFKKYLFFSNYSEKQKTKFPNSLYKASITLTPKPKTLQKEENQGCLGDAVC